MQQNSVKTFCVKVHSHRQRKADCTVRHVFTHVCHRADLHKTHFCLTCFVNSSRPEFLYENPQTLQSLIISVCL